MALENGRLRGDDLEAVLVLKWYESVRRRKCVLDASLLLPILHPSQSPLSRSLPHFILRTPLLDTLNTEVTGMTISLSIHGI